MNIYSVLNVIFVILIVDSNCEKLSRSKRFLSSIWPSSPPANAKKDANEVLYLHLTPEYIEMMHDELQRRADTNLPLRFIPPTKMSQSKFTIAPQPPKIIMRPKLESPPASVTLTQEQALPEIHKTHRFVTPTPFPKTSTIKPFPYSQQQALPIKRSLEPNLISAPAPSIKTADISEFYFTREFNDLLKEFKLKVNHNKLPDIKDIMTILNTENAEETLKAIREVASSAEGMELISSYLEASDRVEDDEFYSFHEDADVGVIHVDSNDFHEKHIQDGGILQSDDASQYNFSPIKNPVAVTESWWLQPLHWLGFGGSKSTAVESLQKDASILANVVKKPENIADPFSYARNFFTTSNRDSVPIESLHNEKKLLENAANLQTLPTVQMTEEEFDKMIRELHLRPIYPKTITTTTTTRSLVDEKLSAPIYEQSQVFENPVNVLSEEIDIPDPQIPQKVDRPVPPQLSEYENRRSFKSISEPIRHSSSESRTGKIYQVDPEIVQKESQSLSSGNEEGNLNKFNTKSLI